MNKKYVWQWLSDGVFRGVIFYLLTQYTASPLIAEISGLCSILISMVCAVVSTIVTVSIILRNKSNNFIGYLISFASYIGIIVLILINNQYFYFDPFPNRAADGHEALSIAFILAIYVVGAFVFRLASLIVISICRFHKQEQSGDGSLIDN